jgi:peroxiredoxin
MALLQPGDRFPDIEITPVGASPITVLTSLAGHFGVVLFYRGSWCPYCNVQLSAFQRAHGSLHALEASVIALSVDDEATTKELVNKHNLEFPVGFGADADAIAAAAGAFVNPEPKFLQSTGFVLDPEGRVVVSVYSSGAIGRLVPDDVVGMIKYVRAHSQA